MLITKNNIELFSKNKTLLKENKTQMYNQFKSKEFEVLFHQ